MSDKQLDLNNPQLSSAEIELFQMHCHICKHKVAEVESSAYCYDRIMYHGKSEYKIYCKKCHDELDAVQARLQKKATLIFFTTEQLRLLQEILERYTKLFLQDQELQESIKKGDYDTLPVDHPTRSKLNRSIEINKMYRKVNRSMSELGLFDLHS